MKKIVSLISALALVFSLASCGSGDSSGAGAEEKAKEFHSAESAQAFVKNMGVGWNLGNTLDPNNCTWVETDLDYETAWGNPKATKELIDFVKSEGFKTIRIPTTWGDHTEGDDYRIKSEWAQRVQEVVDWCIEDGLYVILNIHHEGDWLTKASTDYDGTIKKYKAIWEQIAERFKNYDEHLVFESMNEIGFDDLGTQKGCELMNKINMEFTDLVRKSGGNNDKRYLLLAGYWTDIDRTIEGGIKMPEGDDHTILSVHYYSPSTFAIADLSSTWGYQETWGTQEDFEYLDSQMKKMKEAYVDKGTPVIIGEFGATHKDKDMEDVVLYTASVIEYALKYDMCPVWWDPGQEIDRTELYYKVDGMQEAVHNAMNGGSASIDKAA